MTEPINLTDKIVKDVFRINEKPYQDGLDITGLADAAYPLAVAYRNYKRALEEIAKPGCEDVGDDDTTPNGFRCAQATGNQRYPVCNPCIARLTLASQEWDVWKEFKK